MLIKLSHEQVEKLEASDPAIALEKISALIDTMSTPATPKAEAPFARQYIDIDFKAVFDRLEACEAKLATLTAASVTTVALGEFKTNVLAEAKTISTAEGSRAACAALAATGTNPLRASVVEEPDTKATDQLEAAGKFEEQWKVDPKIQAEFSNPSVYASYRKAVAGGHIST